MTTTTAELLAISTYPGLSNAHMQCFYITPYTYEHQACSSTAQTPLLRFVVDLLYNKLYSKSTTNTRLFDKSTTNPQHLDMSRNITCIDYETELNFRNLTFRVTKSRKSYPGVVKFYSQKGRLNYIVSGTLFKCQSKKIGLTVFSNLPGVLAN
jgi:hypothetical protein